MVLGTCPLLAAFAKNSGRLTDGQGEYIIKAVKECVAQWSCISSGKIIISNTAIREVTT